MAFCRARRASAKPPARLGVGELRPKSEDAVLVPFPDLPMLNPESRGASGGAGATFRPAAAGRLAGGAGGVGLARTADALIPLGFEAVATGGAGGIGRVGGGGGATGCSTFSR